MANASVFTGADGSITLSSPQGTEGEKAQEVLSAYEMIAVGRVQNVQVQVRSDVKAFHEIGQRYATELRPGNVHITGTIGRAYINGAMLKLMLGEAADGRPDVKMDQWVYTIPEDDFVLESVSFQALYLTVQDES
jgi:predicted RecB family endonuclease